MKQLSGSLIARLAEADETYDQELIDQINDQVKPPRPVKAEDVHIRAMYIVSDQINSQGGCFVEDDLDRLTELLADSPVMVGHRRDSLPVARNFKAEKVELDGRIWIKSYFYWMKESDSGDALIKNIDGGIYKECSISFLFKFPECSICGEDIRGCRHIPFHEYENGSGVREIAHFKYRQIEKVLETSLVFRGAVPETKITDRLSGGKTDQIAGVVTTAALYTKTENGDALGFNGFSRADICLGIENHSNQTSTIKPFLTFPHQPGLALRVTRDAEKIELESTILLSAQIQKYLIERIKEIPSRSFIADFLLYATRGKERRDGLALMQIIETETNLHRLRLRLCDLLQTDGISRLDRSYAERLQILPGWLFGEQPLEAATSGIEILQPRKSTAEELSRYRRQGALDKYKFGLEIIVENDTGGLTRHIMRQEKLIPARVEGITVKSRRHLRGSFVPLTGSPSSLSLTCPRLAGLEPGTVVLLQGISSNGRKSPQVSLVDILPGGEAARVRMIDSGRSSKPPVLSILSDQDRLLIFFGCDKKRYLARIHHFSSRLLEEGRRFIVDLETTDEELPPSSVGEQVALISITKTGGVFHLKPAGENSIFGKVTDLWFSPVLIDRKARHLFHADRSIDLQEE